MSKTFNTTLVAGTNTYFDLHDYVHDIPEAYVAAQVAQSTAWRIDTLLVSNARSVFKNVREELYHQGIDQMAELTMALQDADFSMSSFQDAGLPIEGPIETIRSLAMQRDQWHNLAQGLTSMVSDYTGQPRRYDIPDLESVFFAEPNLRVNAQTTRRIAISSRRMAEAYGLGDEGAKTFEERRLAREQDNLKSISNRLTEQAGGVWFMYKNVLMSGEAHAVTEFYKLPLSVQRTLVTNAQTAAQRADDFACKERSMTDMEYDRILACVLKVDADLRKVIGGERFVIAQRVAEAATI
jgi:hypothetical protein